MKAIGEQIKKTISESVSHKRGNSSNEIEKKEILLTDGNNFCTDCNSPSKGLVVYSNHTPGVPTQHNYGPLFIVQIGCIHQEQIIGYTYVPIHVYMVIMTCMV